MVQSARLSSRGLRFSFKKHVFVVVFVLEGRVSFSGKDRNCIRVWLLTRVTYCLNTLFLSSRMQRYPDAIFLER